MRSATDDPRLPSADTFDASLDVCRLHVCIQWLGYASQWTERHGRRWIAEALPIGARLGLLADP
jgi:hypothetical protein